ncbi:MULTISPECIES: nickel ABC transporter substrate-binding protein [Bacillaceae]|uniref:ABC transporter substrate-binding protein n=1 Tax=Alkalicoccobacillus plakortidis TaxID=444060 RepID=A0A9D5I2Q2_9BACI|nr:MULTISPECIES: nickel ABC transporter substrate-binding protein [Bacillaceae]KQL58945.1 ABC transporter substrate-binding protein [Alkalicoccobacillus plakortidis]
MVKASRVTYVVACSALLLFTACSSDTNTTNQTELKEATFLFNFPSQTIDPSLDYTPLRAGVTETLVKLNDDDLSIEPWLAEDWQSEDGQHWTFTIRSEVLFHNGEPLTAESVKQSLERAMEQNPGVMEVLNIDYMEASDQTLTIVTNEPFPQFPSELVHPNASILEVGASEPEQRPVGTGPFMVDSFVANSALDVKRFDEYWDGAARLDQARFTFNEDESARLSALKSGGADIVYRPPVDSLTDLEADPLYKTESVVGLRTHELIFNTRNEWFEDESIRKAFDALVDREELMNEIMSGQAVLANGPFLPDFEFTPEYDQKDTGKETALAWFEEAGFETENEVVTKEGEPLHFTLVTYTSRAEFPILAQALQSKAKEIGITISIEVVDNYEEYLLQEESWDIGMYSPLIAPRGDASYFLNVSFKPDGALNFSKVDHPELTSIIDELDKTIDESERNQLIEDALLLIDQETYYSYLVHPNIVVAMNDRVENWNTSRSEYYMLTNELDVDGD